MKKLLLTLSTFAAVAANAQTTFTEGNITYTQTSEGLKKIGESAFYGNGVTELEIPASVDSIKGKAFLYSKSLEKLTLHDGLKYIGDGAFNNNVMLHEVTLPGTVEVLGREAFFNDILLTKINIPANLKEIGQCALAGTHVYDITLDPANKYFVNDKGVIYTKDYKVLTLAPLTGLKTYTVNKKCLGIGGGAFQGSEIESIKLGDNIVAIGYGAFEASQLKSINWPKRLSFIDEQAFANTQFTEITLPETVYYINDGVFAGCKNLTTVTIPSGVTEVYNHAFTNSSNLKTVIAKGGSAPALLDAYETVEEPFYGISSTAALSVPKGAKVAYTKAGWGDYFKITEREEGFLKVAKITPADSSALGKFTSFSFSVEFAENVTLVEKNPDVYIREGENYSSVYIEPTGDPQWGAMIEAGKTLTVFGNDYDGYMDTFMPKADTKYYVTIPAGVVKNADGVLNDQITILYYGPTSVPTSIDEYAAPAENKVVARYNLNGQVVDANQKGIQIVKYADGSAKKVVVK